MKAQMKFQKWLCLGMIIVGALSLLYAFCYMTGSMSELGQSIDIVGTNRSSRFNAGYDENGNLLNDALLYDEMQPFNTMMMYFGIAMILLAVLLYITACNKRRNYYVSNYIATGLCAGGNIVMSIVCLIMNIHWRSEFLNVDFESWKALLDDKLTVPHYSESTLWFDIGFAVYAIVIVASIILVLNMVWKIMLMKGEKQLLSNGAITGGEAA